MLFVPGSTARTGVRPVPVSDKRETRPAALVTVSGALRTPAAAGVKVTFRTQSTVVSELLVHPAEESAAVNSVNPAGKVYGEDAAGVSPAPK